MAFEGSGVVLQDVAARIAEHGPELSELAWENERLGRLSDRTVEILRAVGIMRILQPKEHGGLGGTPAEFLEAVMTAARFDGSAGWIGGVVGVHPWEVSLFDPQLAADIWGQNRDTWIASPYTPSGIAEPVDGGYRLTGRWQFSSGTDHAEWVFLGALLGDGTGKPAMPPRAMHLILPRTEYEIIADSWDVIGLLGTGSKDVVVNGAFVPTYRAIFHDDVASGAAAEKMGLTDPIYKLPFSAIFPVGITGAIVGMAEGALAAHAAYQRDRVSAAGSRLRDDPYAGYFAGEAAAEIHASRAQLFAGINWAYEQVMSGKGISFEDRSRIRRNQIRCAWRAVAAIDTIYARSGGNSSRRTNPIQRFWRDAHVGLNHFIHVPGPTYNANAIAQYGLEVPEALRIGI